MKNKIPILIILTVFLSLAFVSAWADNSFNYKQPVNINVTFANLNETSVLLTVTHNANMKNDFGDLRFFDSDDSTPLGYWFYNNSFISGTSVQVWVKTGDLNSTSNKTIFMYYGNPSATTTSNIDNAFLFGDDFNGTSVDFTNKWQSTQQGNYFINNGMLNATTFGLSGSGAKIETQTRFSDGFDVESRLKVTNSASDSYAMSLEDVAGVFTGGNYNEIIAGAFNVVITTSNTGGTANSDTFYRSLYLFPSGGNPTGNWTDDDLNNLLGFNQATVRVSGFIGYLPFTSDILVDWIYVTRDLPNLPITSFGSEESNIAVDESIITSFVSPTSNGTLINNQTITANVSVTTQNLTSVQVRLYNSNHSLIANSSGVNTFVQFNGLTKGTYYLNATASNVFGNSNNTQTNTITLDGNLLINFVSPTSNGTLGGEITILANVTISPSITNDVHIFLFNSNHTLRTDFHTGGSFTNYFYDYGQFDEFELGTYYLNATVTNDFGLINYTETRTIILNSALLMDFVSPTSNGLLTSDRIKVNLTSFSLNLTNVIVSLYNSTGLVVSANSSSNQFYVEFTGLENGQYFLNATGLNGFGTTNKTSTNTINFTNGVVVIPAQSLSSPIYQVLNSAGAGLAKFIVNFSVPFALLLMVFLVVAMFVIIGKGIKELLTGKKLMGSK